MGQIKLQPPNLLRKRLSIQKQIAASTLSIRALANTTPKRSTCWCASTPKLHLVTPLPVKDGKRELVIGCITQGYLALYRYVAAIDTVFVLAIRAQREDGFKRENEV